jgi:hypothetical protein
VHRMFLCLALILSASLGAIAIAKEAQPRTTEEAQVICTRTGCVPLPRDVLQNARKLLDTQRAMSQPSAHQEFHPENRSCVAGNVEVSPMSALGHKRTFAIRNVMSALPPKADMCSARGDVR